MTFSPCLLIPIYNHGGGIRRTVERLAPHGVPILVVDDGSDEPTRIVLAQLAADFRLVRLHRLDRNSGKGAAVMHGMLLARADGFTHALQFDADVTRATRINTEAFLTETGAQMWIQHDPPTNAKLKKAPEYYD